MIGSICRASLEKLCLGAPSASASATRNIAAETPLHKRAAQTLQRSINACCIASSRLTELIARTTERKLHLRPHCNRHPKFVFVCVSFHCRPLPSQRVFQRKQEGRLVTRTTVEIGSSTRWPAKESLAP